MDRRQAATSRRDFLGIAAWGMGLTTVGAGLWTVLGATVTPRMPDPDRQHVDLKWLAAGERQTFPVGNRPVTVWRRTPEQVAQARGIERASLRDPLARNANLDPKAVAEDANRSFGDVIAVWAQCTKSACVPQIGAGDFGGWFCPCCASHYDLSGRIRKGPAPRNLGIPRYTIAEDILTVYPEGDGPVSEDQLDRLLRG